MITGPDASMGPTPDVMFCSCCLKIVYDFEQRFPHFRFAWGLGSSVAGSAPVSCPRSLSIVRLSQDSNPDCLALSFHLYVLWLPISHILKASSLHLFSLGLSLKAGGLTHLVEFLGI